MRIASLAVKNFRTIESLKIDFRSNYAALCGPNDSGKTNVIRALRSLLGDDGGSNPFADRAHVTYKDDFPKWKSPSPGDDSVEITAEVEIDSVRDAGLYQSTLKQMSIADGPSVLKLTITTSHHAERSAQRVVVQHGADTIDGVSAQEVLSRIQNAKSVVFHNSTAPMPRMFAMSGMALGVLRDLSAESEAVLGKTQKAVNKALAKVAKGRQREFEELLGKLERKYKVGLSVPTFEVMDVPFGITLGENSFQVRLDEWGSGTRNRTQILLALFTAKKISESEESASKTTPLLILEEPECFLHPSAQAEFGRVVHDLADEFEIQVIVTTHSPYMLSLVDVESNVLLERRLCRGAYRGTERRDTTGENWMQPFAHALGMAADEFKPWRQLFTGGGDAVLLVEGESDKAYFELMRDARHGKNRLDFAGEIISYGGVDALSNDNLLRFIKAQLKKVFVTFDLDCEAKVVKALEKVGFERNKSYMAIGKVSAGRKDIEGLLPDSVKAAVRAKHPELVDAATQAEGEERRSARNRLKSAYLDEFKRKCKPTEEYFGDFYPVVRAINASLSTPKE